MSFAGLVQEARRVTAAMGTWVVHEAAKAESHAELVGFFRYCSHGLERLNARLNARLREVEDAGKKQSASHVKKTAETVKTWIGLWRRATRWLLSIDPSQTQAIATAVLRQVEGEPYYVACGHPWLEEGDTAPRVPGRPRVRALPRVYRECSTCGGFGWA